MITFHISPSLPHRKYKSTVARHYFTILPIISKYELNSGAIRENQLLFPMSSTKNHRFRYRKSSSSTFSSQTLISSCTIWYRTPEDMVNSKITWSVKVASVKANRAHPLLLEIDDPILVTSLFVPTLRDLAPPRANQGAFQTFLTS